MGDSPAAARLRLALDIYAFGEQMERTRLRRLDRGATDAEIDAAISAWLRTRPDAPVGDALAARRTGLDEPAGGRASARG